MTESNGQLLSGALVKSEVVTSGTLRIEDWNALLGVEDMKLPDGIVEGTTFDDWQRLLDCLAQTPWVATFNNDGVSVPAFTVTEMFDGDAAAKTISIELVCGAVVNVFVYQPNSVDFDFNLDEIECQQGLDQFLDFVRLVGQQTKRDVSLRYEGSHHSFGGYRHESDHFFLIGSEPQSRVDSSIQTGDSQVDERRNWERSRLVVAAARLREFRNLEIGLKQLIDDLLPVIEEQTALPHFWSETAMNAWGQLEVDYALALDAATSIPAFTYQPVRENVIELEDLIEEGKRRLSLLDSPLNRFAFDQPLKKILSVSTCTPSCSSTPTRNPHRRRLPHSGLTTNETIAGCLRRRVEHQRDGEVRQA